MIHIGIDPGTHTGLAVWDGEKFLKIGTYKILDAINIVSTLSDSDEVIVYFEDARQRKWYGARSSEKLQGAGSIKRDCAIWEEFLNASDIPFRMIAPSKGCTKMSDERFRSLTGWGKITSNHARDAAMLVFGR